MAKIRNPLGPKNSVGNGYFVQSVRLGKDRGYVKIWHHDKVIDTALTVTSAKANVKRRVQRGMFPAEELPNKRD